MPLDDWRTRAACIGSDPDLWFPADNAARARTQHIRAICAGCPVSAECLQAASDLDARYGIWGGLDEVERANGPKVKTIEHGTSRGYRQHRTAGEDACQDCKDANNAKNRREYANKPLRKRTRSRARNRDAA